MFVVALARGRHRVTRRDLVVAVPMLLLAFWAVRNVAVAPLIGLPVVARAFARDEEKPSDVERHARRGRDQPSSCVAALGDGLPGDDGEDVRLLVVSRSSVDARTCERHDLSARRLLTTTPPPAT